MSCAMSSQVLHGKLKEKLITGYLNRTVGDGKNFTRWKIYIEEILKTQRKNFPVFDDFDELEKTGKMAVGEYDILLDVFSKIDKQACDVIRKIGSKIQYIQRQEGKHQQGAPRRITLQIKVETNLSGIPKSNRSAQSVIKESGLSSHSATSAQAPKESSLTSHTTTSAQAPKESGSTSYTTASAQAAKESGSPSPATTSAQAPKESGSTSHTTTFAQAPKESDSTSHTTTSAQAPIKSGSSKPGSMEDEISQINENLCDILRIMVDKISSRKTIKGKRQAFLNLFDTIKSTRAMDDDLKKLKPVVNQLVEKAKSFCEKSKKAEKTLLEKMFDFLENFKKRYNNALIYGIHIGSIQFYLEYEANDDFEKYKSDTGQTPLAAISDFFVFCYQTADYNLTAEEIVVSSSVVNKEEEIKSAFEELMLDEKNQGIPLEMVLKSTSSILIPTIRRIFHIVSLSKDRFWVGDGRGKILQVDAGGQIITELQTDITGGQFSLTNSGDLLFIDDADNGNWLKKWNNSKTENFLATNNWRPVCVHISNLNNNVLVALTYTTEMKVVRYDTNGKELQAYQCDNDGKPFYSDVLYITENVNGDICVSDWKNGVVAVTKSGGLHFRYEIDRPCGITTDDTGYIIVCNALNNLHVLNQEGSLVTILQTDTNGIRSVCLSNKSNLCVGCLTSSVIKVFPYPL